jgi:CDP-glucose 4,6-dehydratase
VARRSGALEGMVMDRAFWQGKRVFVTGHTGFKGGWLTLWLQSLGAEVTGFSLAPDTVPNLFTLARVSEGIRSIIGDVRDQHAISQAIELARPEIIFHMAAQPFVRYSYTHPVETYATNVMGTIHVLEAVRNVPSVKTVLVVTTDKCYENREWVWGYREIDAMGGHDPYSSSKACVELVTAAYRNSYFSSNQQAKREVGLASVRAGNVIGGGDWAAERLIPDIIRAVVRNEPVLIRFPQAIRPWQHVLEPLCGYLTLAAKLSKDRVRYGEGWNFGPEDFDIKSVKWVVENLTEHWGEGASWTLDENSQPHEASILKLDSSKARSLLGWNPLWRLDQSIERVVDWYKAARRGEDMRAFTLAEIEAYQSST